MPTGIGLIQRVDPSAAAGKGQMVENADTPDNFAGRQEQQADEDADEEESHVYESDAGWRKVPDLAGRTPARLISLRQGKSLADAAENSSSNVPPEALRDLPPFMHAVKKRTALDARTAKEKRAYKVFPKQDLAFEHQDKITSASQAEAGSQSQSTAGQQRSTRVLSQEVSSKGGRQYVVWEWAAFERWYVRRTLDPKGKRSHWYEVIREGMPCRLYFDMEFSREANPTLDGDALVRRWLDAVQAKLLHDHGATVESDGIVQLDSTTERKFSRHVILHLEGGRLFASNVHAGHLVNQLLGEQLLAHAKATTAAAAPPQRTCTVPSPPSAATNGSSPCNRGYTASQAEACLATLALSTQIDDVDTQTATQDGGMGVGSSCWLMVEGEGGKHVSFVDTSVYTRNRCFRPMEDCDASITTANTQTCQDVVAETDRRIKLLRSAMIVPVPDADNMESPFPLVDEFISAYITQQGREGRIRQWEYSDGLITYQIVGNRYCQNIGRQHKSNNIMLIVDLRKGCFWQKCHDPECRRMQYRSPSVMLDDDLIPTAAQLEEIDEDLIIAQAMRESPDAWG
ncbi:hypothetical protein JKP88DRAFT_320964 [Tribonema minus]|uniref:DNA-directed primase/polymerase protein n=1 Tax=Tribonema minus TaxID=303371 RepID=A0A835YVT3_9STRA|nr:hypothetical protein JKP88DRAFT_320964 [Tribonema minus]